MKSYNREDKRKERHMTERDTLRNWLKESDNIVFFGGAGVSTESKIPDFRSTDGLYNQQYAYPPETILSHTFYLRKTEEFYRFYRNKMLFPDAEPNRAHRALAALERMGKLRAVLTQNIDGLHQKAGSREVLELHGSVLRNFCTRCKKFHGLDAILASQGVPVCDCGGVIKPDVVLYEEGLDQETLEKAVSYLSQADMLIVGGTSLTVYPAAGLLNYYRGNRLVLINKSVTPMDGRADLVISGPIGEVLGEAVEGMCDGV
jgi:NAD-dependent deacetylase